MFSVIIPTMWRSWRLEKQLQQLNTCTAVGEIIIIDNDSINTPNLNISKLKTISTGKNEYVNSSWNLGVENSSYDDIAIINDDISFNTDIFEYIKIPEMSIVGADPSCYNLTTNTEYNIREAPYRWYGFGCIFFIRKKDYLPIPNCLKIYCGDDYLFWSLKKRYTFLGLSIETEMSVTSNDPDYKDILDNDILNFKNLNINIPKNLNLNFY